MKFASMFALAVALTFGGSAFGAEPAAPAAPEATAPAAAAAPTTTAPSTTRAKGFRNRTTKNVGLRAKLRNKFAR